jgi:hypothetical protein
VIPLRLAQQQEVPMPRFPKARRKNKSVSVFEQAHRFYGEAFEVTSSHDMADAMAEWGDLAPSERTFTLTHLLYLNLMAQAGTHLLLRKVWDAVEELADEMEDQAARGGEGDDEDEEGEGDPVVEQEVDDLEADDGEPAEAPVAPPEVTIPAAVTPQVDEDDEGDDQSDWPEPDDLDEGDEG